MTDDKVLAIFKTFDVDNNGEITHKNLHDAFTKFGMEITEDEITEVMLYHDADGGNSISLEEFKEMIKPKEKTTLVD